MSASGVVVAPPPQPTIEYASVLSPLLALLVCHFEHTVVCQIFGRDTMP